MAAAIAVAASGGTDSTALLHCAARLASPLRVAVHALHVHHGLQPAADDWVQQLTRQLARWRRAGLLVHLHVRRLVGQPGAGDSIEAWARRERYAALTAMAHEAGCPIVLLAHHRRDQAETFLLQALRGGGAAALAAMPAAIERDGLLWCRPWLAQPRAAIETYLRRHRLRAVHDPSNADPRFARGRLRGEPWRALSDAFADAEQTLAAASRRAQSEAAALREWTALDLASVREGDALDVNRWRSLSPARRELVLRCWLQGIDAAAPESLLLRLLAELPEARAAQWPGPAAGQMLRLYRARLRPGPSIERAEGHEAAAAPPGPAAAALDLSRPGVHRLPQWRGALEVCAAPNDGLDPAALRHATLRTRSGGEDFQLGPRRPPRSLKKQYQSLAVPAEHRLAPLVYVGEQLVYVPGLGVDARWQAAHGAGARPGVRLHWSQG